MNDDMKIVYMRSQIVSAECKLTAMRAANQQVYLRESFGAPRSKTPIILPYTQEDFDRIPVEFGITHNQVIGFFTDRG